LKKQLLILAITIIFLASAVSAAEQTFFGKTAFGQAEHKHNALIPDGEYALMNPWHLDNMGVKDYLFQQEYSCVKLNSVKIGVTYNAHDPICGTEMTVHYKIGGHDGKESQEFTVESGTHTVYLDITKFKMKQGNKWVKWDAEDLDKIKGLVDLSVDDCDGEYSSEFCPPINRGWVGIDSIFLVVDCQCVNPWIGYPDGPAWQTNLIACEEQIEP